jgi:hypothetical protein
VRFHLEVFILEEAEEELFIKHQDQDQILLKAVVDLEEEAQEEHPLFLL